MNMFTLITLEGRASVNGAESVISVNVTYHMNF